MPNSYLPLTHPIVQASRRVRRHLQRAPHPSKGVNGSGVGERLLYLSQSFPPSLRNSTPSRRQSSPSRRSYQVLDPPLSDPYP